MVCVSDGRICGSAAQSHLPTADGHRLPKHLSRFVKFPKDAPVVAISSFSASTKTDSSEEGLSFLSRRPIPDRRRLSQSCERFLYG
jgi:hypothetical protein